MRATAPKDLYQTITDSIIASIEAGVGECVLPWQRSGLPTLLPKNASTQGFYAGINILGLWASAEIRSYPYALWGSYRQWASMGAQVRAGEKGTMIVFYREYDVEPSSKDSDDDGKRYVAKHSYVFNVSQVDGYDLPVIPEKEPLARHEAAQRFIEATGADVRIGGERAYYSPGTDHIQMPSENLFQSPDAETRIKDFTSVQLHELGHWSGHSSRLARQFGKRFGDDAYAVEELVAELTSAFLCAQLGVTSIPRHDHAQYIAHWLQILKADKKAVFTAAAKASEAARFLSAFSAQRELADAA